MRTEIRLADGRKSLNLLYALYAITNGDAHEDNQISFYSNDGEFVLLVRTPDNYVSFGRVIEPERSTAWTDNLAVGEVIHLLGMFLAVRYEELTARIRECNEP